MLRIVAGATEDVGLRPNPCAPMLAEGPPVETEPSSITVSRVSRSPSAATRASGEAHHAPWRRQHFAARIDPISRRRPFTRVFLSTRR